MVRDLYYLRARYYDPEIGRFWSRDPWRGSTALPQTLAGYSYVANNPVNAADPRGLCHIVPCWEEGQPVPLWPPGPVDVPDIPIEFDPGGAAERWRAVGEAAGDAWGGVTSLFGSNQDSARRYGSGSPDWLIRIRSAVSQPPTWQNFKLDCRVFRNFRHAKWARRACWGIGGAIIGCFVYEQAAPILWGEKPPSCTGPGG